MTINQQGRIVIHNSVLPALDALTEEERQSVLKTINSLEISPIQQLIKSQNIAKLKADEELYVIRVNPSLRIIFRMTSPDKIEILDIFMKERIEFLFDNSPKIIL
ncbi:hypothetical protein ACE1B6_25070 [Aerosakkonemataceae cyanobacterium BLCC-F154]|uniref:Uncharacterized protein n=1 Tax=Floridaenema fluviatile BLCC-F154 TaxID=3153640 RepID=A0ABV4YK01_9CYAN